MNLYDVNSGYMPTYNSMMIMPTMIMPPLMPNDVNEAIIILFADFSHENQPKVLKNVNFLLVFIKIILCVSFYL